MTTESTSTDSARTSKWELRRQTIIDTSARVFARQGYHATGIMELCAANDLGKGALYHYIGSKEELLAGIHDRVMDEVMLGADRVAATGGEASQQLAMLGDELLDVIHRYPDHVWVFPPSPVNGPSSSGCAANGTSVRSKASCATASRAASSATSIPG
jgi:AcrR family transcriptional regulator